MKAYTISGEVEQAMQAAIAVLQHNRRGPYNGLPRTAGWGYPEPYTRDLVFTFFGIAVSGDEQLIGSMRKVLETLASNQTIHGHIPSLVHDGENLGASDTTPLFLVGISIYRQLTGEKDFLQEAVVKSLSWLAHQSPSDRLLVAQLPTTDWRDEQWVLGYGLYVNTLVYACLRMFDEHERADDFLQEMRHFTITSNVMNRHVHEGLTVKNKPYYAFWSFKVYSSERFDLLGNSLAILTGIASPSRAERMIAWIEEECRVMREKGELAADLPPNFFPFVQPGDPDWRSRDEQFNKPGDYHNGGIWPFICGVYVAALVAAGKYQLAEKKLLALTALVKAVNAQQLDYGFNEWLHAQDALPKGQNWQSWSAALYIYAVKCVAERRTPFFEEMRKKSSREK
ncbi:glycoside hydrolase 100 family protein [Chitinophaga flava]|uniref:beta-fructofuranosidase n=1 Tax=Chitinophaga flava TaxID=2259036 RepID=A0A365XRF5_9BACT|nr:glycoside hydrolase 100 family protein [Chitinophaga flava]RBL88922.1 amylo-alpha-1,6-glucosidase [Chitinophaga flava]